MPGTAAGAPLPGGPGGLGVRAGVHPEAGVPADPRGQGRVVGADHAALAAGDPLARVQGEDRYLAEAAARAAAVGPARRTGGVLDQEQPVMPGDLLERAPVGGHAEGVDRHDGPGPRRDGGLDEVRVDRAGVRANIDKDRGRAAVQHGVPGPREAVVGHDDLVARSQP